MCKKVFKKADVLRKHKRIHASHKPVLVCPRDDCQAYFSTTFNLQHHIRKVHLELLKYKCCFPDCPRMFAMRVSNKSSIKGLVLDVSELFSLLSDLSIFHHFWLQNSISESYHWVSILRSQLWLCLPQESMTRHLLRHDANATILKASVMSVSHKADVD